MADFRRWILALATLALVLGCVAPASAQYQVTCSVAGGVPPILRTEGMDELVGDILLTCTPASPTVKPVTGSVLPQADITVSLGASLSTNSYANPNVSIGTVSSALLLIDDPTPPNQLLCPAPSNPLVACGVEFPNGTTNFSFNQQIEGYPIYNVFQGIPGGPGTYSITFLGVPIEPPTTSRTFRITNLRINASGVATSPIGLSPVSAYVSSSSSTSLVIPNGGQTVVGYVETGLTATTKPSATAYSQCQGAGTSTAGVNVGSITFKENFATAFKVVGSGQNTPGVVYNSESGLELTVFGSTGTAPSITSSAATTGTRLMATISGIPSNATMWIDSWAQSPAAVITDGVVVAQSDASIVTVTSGPQPDACPTTVGASCIPPTKLTPSSAGVATVVWEVTATNPSAIDSLTFNIYVYFPAAPGAATPPSTTVVGSFAPIALSTQWNNGDPIPEFAPGINTQTTSSALFTVSPCVTYLLFPYVTDYLGEFDTGIAISNTSTDPSLGALPQAGACSINFYGMDQTTGADTAKTIGSSGVYSTTLAGINSGASSGAGLVEPGQTWTFSVSGIDSAFGTNTFTGYAIATCNFQYAHGYTFVSDYGVREWAAASLALVIPDTGLRGPYPFVCGALTGTGTNAGCNGSQTGEQLVH